MGDDRANPFVKGQLRVEATDWWIRMHSAEADQHRAEFERWLARGAMHLAAYNRVANLYGQGKSVSWETLPPPRPVRGRARLLVLAALGAVMLLGFLCWRIISAPAPVLVAGSLPPSATGLKPSQQTQFLTRLGEIRRVRLSDGSWLTLDTDTLVTVDLEPGQRALRVEHGRARFDVAHERRPFVVDAGESEVTAHGTIFDVTYWQGTAHVQLLRGAISVKRATSRSARPVETANLSAGQGLTYPDDDASGRLAGPKQENVADWPSGRLDFSSSPLSEVVATANRYSTVKIALGEPRLEELRLSGVYRAGDTASLANSMSTLFGLDVHADHGRIILSRR